MDTLKIHAIGIFVFIAFIIGYAFWSYENDVVYRSEVFNWATVAMFVYLGQIFIRGLYKVLKNPQSPWRYHLKSKLFFGIVTVVIVTLLLNEFSESVANYFNLIEEPPNYKDHYQILKVGIPVCLSIIIITALTYQSKYTNYRRDFRESRKNILKNSDRWDSIKHNFDTETKIDVLVLRNFLINNFNDYWYEASRIPKMIIAIAGLLCILCASTLWAIHSTDSETPLSYVDIFTDAFFISSSFFLFWAYLHSTAEWHEKILLWLDQMSTKFEVDVETKFLEIRSNEENEKKILSFLNSQ